MHDLIFWGREFQRDAPVKDVLVLISQNLSLARRASVVGLVTNEELWQVIWVIIIKNFMHKYSFIVSELL